MMPVGAAVRLLGSHIGDKRTDAAVVCVDDAGNVADVGAAATTAGVAIDVLVEINVGSGRCGVAPGEEAVALAKRVSSTEGLRFAGLQAYHGRAQHIRDHAERGRAIESAVSLARGTVDLLAREGIECEAVTGAGTGTYEVQGRSGLFSELQTGSYIFMDRQYCEIGGKGGEVYDDFEPALFVLATVMSVPAADRVVVDAGYKALSSDAGPALLLGKPGWTYGYGGDEHGIVRGGGDAAPMTLGETCRPPWPSWMQGRAPTEAIASASGASASAARAGQSQAMAFSTRPSGATAEKPTVASAVPWLRVR